MSKGKDPAVLFYTDDFLAGTFTMSNEQVGKYIRLLCLQHQKHQLTKKDMLNICQTYDKDIFGKFLKEGEFYFNERMRKEAIKRKKYSESRKDNRLSKSYDTTYVTTYDKHMGNGNGNGDVNRNEFINEFTGIVPFSHFMTDDQNTDVEFTKKWFDWTELNEDRKTKITPHTAKEQLKFLATKTIKESIEIMDNSIKNNYKGLFESNGKNNVKVEEIPFYETDPDAWKKNK